MLLRLTGTKGRAGPALAAAVGGGKGAARGGLARALSCAVGGAKNEAEWEYEHDVIVVGGGIVGCSLACRLAQDILASHTRPGGQKRPSVGLVEARPPPPLEVALARDSPDPRVYSLTPQSARLLEAVGVWEGVGDAGREAVLKSRAQPFRGMQVWDDRGPGHLHFDEERGKPLGFISEHGVVHSALFDRVRELEKEGVVHLACPAEVKHVTFPRVGAGGAVGPATVTVQSEDGTTRDVTCRLLVASDGGNSKVAKMLGLSSWGWGYGQRAVVATVKLAESHRETAFQRYLSRGPLAMLPLLDGCASLVWSTTPGHAEALKAMSEEAFLDEVNTALRLPHKTVGATDSTRSSTSSSANSSELASPFSTVASVMGTSPASGLEVSKIFSGFSALAAPPVNAASAVADGFVTGAEGIAGALAGLSLGLGGAGEGGNGFSFPPEAVKVMTPRLGFDLSLRQAHRYTGDRAALVGDAAHTVHPMGGQGLNLGIADADALARAVLEGRRSGTDVGSRTLLTRYENERKTEALVMMSALDSLHRLFGVDGRAVSAVRSAGLSVLNAAGPVKRRLARHAMGGGQ